MWGADDTFGRWIQLLCALVLIPLGVLIEYWWWTTPYSSMTCRAFAATGLAMMYLGYRCTRYATTGKNNINRDDLNSGNFQ
jgi:hypothetical protein